MEILILIFLASIILNKVNNLKISDVIILLIPFTLAMVLTRLLERKLRE